MKHIKNVLSNQELHFLLDLLEDVNYSKYSKDHIKKIQHKHFIKLLKYVLENSKFYREYYGDHNINLDNIKNIQLEDLPIINKKIVMENFNELVTDNNLKIDSIQRFIASNDNISEKYLEKYEVIHTSGTSGETGIFVYGPEDWHVLDL